MAFDLNTNVFSNHQALNSTVKLHLIFPCTSDVKQWLITATTLPYNRPYFREVFIPILYTFTLIDPPDLA